MSRRAKFYTKKFLGTSRNKPRKLVFWVVKEAGEDKVVKCPWKSRGSFSDTEFDSARSEAELKLRPSTSQIELKLRPSVRRVKTKFPDWMREEAAEKENWLLDRHSDP